MDQLTDPGPLSILMLILFIGMLTVVDCVVGNIFEIRQGGGERSELRLPRLDKLSLCCLSAQQQYLIVCFFSVSPWHGGVATVWILSTACYSPFANALWPRVSAFFLQEVNFELFSS